MQEVDTPPAGMTPVEVVVDVFDGIRSVGRALGIAPSTVLRWGQRPSGRIPHEYMRPLLDAAHRRGKRLTLEEVVWGRPHLTRKVVTFTTADDAPTGPLGHMARALTRQACAA